MVAATHFELENSSRNLWVTSQVRHLFFTLSIKHTQKELRDNRAHRSTAHQHSRLDDQQWSILHECNRMRVNMFHLELNSGIFLALTFPH